MANLITINFLECNPTPSKGYNVQWRVAGSGDPYTDQGNFFSSPAVFVDGSNPDGTLYEGTITAQGNNINCNPQPGGNTESPEGSGSASSFGYPCGSLISDSTADLMMHNYGFYFLDVEGASHVDLFYDIIGRPNRITLYDNGILLATTGWKGVAPYGGPWGASLSTATTGTIPFNPIAGHEYKILVEAGPAGPSPYDVSDNFQIDVLCS
jgi:hypothetical protein